MTLIEAMASGRPVIGSRVGGIPFVIEDGYNGLSCRPETSKPWLELATECWPTMQWPSAWGATDGSWR